MKHIEGFTLIEMIIAVAISSIIVLGTYTIFDTIFTAQTSISEKLSNIAIYTKLAKLINDDFINMIESNEGIDNNTSEDNNSTSTNNEATNETSSHDKASDNKTKQNYISLSTFNNRPSITFNSYNSIFFNKAVPVKISYFIDTDNYLVRKEISTDLSFEKEIKLIGKVSDIEVSSFNGEKFKENTVNPKLTRFTFTIGKRKYDISAGKIINEKK